MEWTDKFLSKVRQGPDCWEWAGWKERDGYGVQWVTGVGNRRAHRIAYELWVGPIPDGLTLDHLCRNRGCVNPAHLEPVTSVENVARGDTPSVRNRAKTHCDHGHEFTPATTYARAGGKRECKVCVRDRMRARRARQRLECA